MDKLNRFSKFIDNVVIVADLPKLPKNVKDYLIRLHYKDLNFDAIYDYLICCLSKFHNYEKKIETLQKMKEEKLHYDINKHVKHIKFHDFKKKADTNECFTKFKEFDVGILNFEPLEGKYYKSIIMRKEKFPEDDYTSIDIKSAHFSVIIHFVGRHLNGFDVSDYETWEEFMDFQKENYANRSKSLRLMTISNYYKDNKLSKKIINVVNYIVNTIAKFLENQEDYDICMVNHDEILLKGKVNIEKLWEDLKLLESKLGKLSDYVSIEHFKLKYNDGYLEKNNKNMHLSGIKIYAI